METFWTSEKRSNMPSCFASIFYHSSFWKIFHLKWKKNKVIFSEKKNFAIKEITCEAEENLVRQKLQTIEAEAF